MPSLNEFYIISLNLSLFSLQSSRLLLLSCHVTKRCVVTPQRLKLKVFYRVALMLLMARLSSKFSILSICELSSSATKHFVMLMF